MVNRDSLMNVSAFGIRDMCKRFLFIERMI